MYVCANVCGCRCKCGYVRVLRVCGCVCLQCVSQQFPGIELKDHKFYPFEGQNLYHLFSTASTCSSLQSGIFFCGEEFVDRKCMSERERVGKRNWLLIIFPFNCKEFAFLILGNYSKKILRKNVKNSVFKDHFIWVIFLCELIIPINLKFNSIRLHSTHLLYSLLSFPPFFVSLNSFLHLFYSEIHPAKVNFNPLFLLLLVHLIP